MSPTLKSIFLGVFIPPITPISSLSPSLASPQKPLRKKRFLTFLDSPKESKKENKKKNLNDDPLEFKFTFKRNKEEDKEKKEKDNKFLLIKAGSLLKEALKEEDNPLLKDNLSSIINKLEYNINYTRLLIEKPINNPSKKRVINKPTPTTWAEVVKKNINNNISSSIATNKVINKTKKISPPIKKPITNGELSYKEKRLVLVTREKTQTFNSGELKERINIKLRNKLNIKYNIITSIYKNRNNNIIIYTRDNLSPSLLLNNKEV